VRSNHQDLKRVSQNLWRLRRDKGAGQGIARRKTAISDFAAGRLELS
jgi:hypothetical protein